MATQVYFHVGAPKTGTTFLQGVMRHNREALRKQGVLYPGATARDHLHASQVVRGVTKHPGRLERAEAWDRPVAELAEWPGVGIISHEFFGMATEEQARAAIERLAPAEVHVVLTARDYVRQFAADWQESLKMGLDLTLDDFLRRADRNRLPRPWGWNAHDIVGTLERWGAALPPARVHVVTVPAGAPRDLLLRRFCSVVQVDPDTLDLGAAFSNQSLGVVQAELLRRLKPRLAAPLDEAPERPPLVAWLLRARCPAGAERRTFHAATGTGRGAVRAWKQCHRGDPDGRLRRRRRPQGVGADAQDPELRHPSDVSDAEVLDSALVAIERMLTDVRTLTLQRDRMRARAAKRVAPRVGRRLRRALSRRSGRPDGIEPSAQLTATDRGITVRGELEVDRTHDVVINGLHVWSLHPTRDMRQRQASFVCEWPRRRSAPTSTGTADVELRDHVTQEVIGSTWVTLAMAANRSRSATRTAGR